MRKISTTFVMMCSSISTRNMTFDFHKYDTITFRTNETYLVWQSIPSPNAGRYMTHRRRFCFLNEYNLYIPAIQTCYNSTHVIFTNGGDTYSSITFNQHVKRWWPSGLIVLYLRGRYPQIDMATWSSVNDSLCERGAGWGPSQYKDDVLPV